MIKRSTLVLKWLPEKWWCKRPPSSNACPRPRDHGWSNFWRYEKHYKLKNPDYIKKIILEEINLLGYVFYKNHIDIDIEMD